MTKANSDSLLIQRVSLVDAVMEQMLDAVRKGRFKPGDKIPSEKVLASEFGVSRATLREAFKRLENEGVLDIKQGNGTYLQNVAAVNSIFSKDKGPDIDTIRMADQGNMMNMVLAKNPISLNDYLDAREALETEAAELAALRATDEDLKRLEKIISMQEMALDNPSVFADLDLTFHAAIMDIAGSQVLYTLWQLLMPHMRQQVKDSVVIDGVVENAFEAHKVVYNLIVSNEDSLKLRTAVVEHIRIVPGRFLFR